MPRYRILACDGGGIKSITTSRILLELETRLREKLKNPTVKIVDYFDLIAATSAGTIISAILLTPTSYTRRINLNNDRVGYDTSDVLAFYQLDGKLIFSESYMHWISSLAGWKGPKYSSAPLAKLLDEYSKTTLLSQLRRNVIFTSWNATQGCPMMFTNLPAIPDRINPVDGKSMPIIKTCVPGLPPNAGISSAPFTNTTTDTVIDDFYLKDVVQSCTSAQTYFPPTTITSVNNKQSFLSIDGGSLVNNPTLYAVSEMKRRGIQDPFLILSLGCGYKPLSLTGCDKFGELDWINPTLNIAINGNDELVNDITPSLLPSGSTYFRINPVLTTANSAMDDASVKNMAALQNDSDVWIIANDALLNQIVNSLIV
jgi:patatin-like phospholipase/acyl hydrolase